MLSRALAKSGMTAQDVIVVPVTLEEHESAYLSDKVDAMVTFDLELFQGRGEKVLLVEDEDDVRKLSERIQSQNGYEVTAAVSAEEAMKIFEESGGDFQIIFSDVVLPRENGIALVGRRWKNTGTEGPSCQRLQRYRRPGYYPRTGIQLHAETTYAAGSAQEDRRDTGLKRQLPKTLLKQRLK